jgi:GGDEF domain-containing protein
MLLPDLDHAHAIETVQSVAERVAACFVDPFIVGERPVVADGSVGISLYPTDGVDAATLMQHADAAMYAAKRTAPGRHVIWSAPNTAT